MQRTREHFGEPLFMSYYSVGEEGATHIEDTGSLSGGEITFAVTDANGPYGSN